MSVVVIVETRTGVVRGQAVYVVKPGLPAVKVPAQSTESIVPVLLKPIWAVEPCVSPEVTKVTAVTCEGSLPSSV